MVRLIDHMEFLKKGTLANGREFDLAIMLYFIREYSPPEIGSSSTGEVWKSQNKKPPSFGEGLRGMECLRDFGRN
jgi:hypothetical protein